MSTRISDAAQAVTANVEKVAATKWAHLTDVISRSVSEAWTATQRDFGRETDKGLKAINDKASADVAQMARDFQTQMVAFGRETDQIVKTTITDPADADVAAMSKSFQAGMDAFNRETTAGLAGARGAPDADRGPARVTRSGQEQHGHAGAPRRPDEGPRRRGHG